MLVTWLSHFLGISLFVTHYAHCEGEEIRILMEKSLAQGNKAKK